MTCRNRNQVRSSLLFSALMSGILVSCASSYAPSSASRSEMPAMAPEAGVANQAMDVAPTPVAAEAQARGEQTSTPRSQPQLVKTAELALTVESVEKGIDSVKQITQQQQGDLLNLQDNTPTSDRTHHIASLQIRVPQNELEPALQALKALGTVERQAITAEDVSDQLVDYQARLRNLRKTEETLLEIMGRSGEIGDVLKVAQELSNVRNSIEQVAAQLNQLQNRVAYSTINLTLQESLASIPPQPSANNQLQETWEQATHSLRKSTVDLLQLGIWLLVYSPYWLILAGVGYFVYTRLQQRRPTTTPDPEN